MKDLDKLIKYSLSDFDIKKFFNNKCKIIKYSEIKNMKSIDDILNPYGFAIILFENNKLNNGHWCLIMECLNNNKIPYILFQDSYGCIIENELNYIPKSFQNMSDQHRGYLLKLLLNQPLRVRYNQYRLQELIEGVNTCGKWACVRACYPTMNEDQFNKMIRSQKIFTPDELICLLYEDLKLNK